MSQKYHSLLKQTNCTTYAVEGYEYVQEFGETQWYIKIKFMHGVIRVMMGIINNEAYNILLPEAVSHWQTPFCSQGEIWNLSKKNVSCQMYINYRNEGWLLLPVCWFWSFLFKLHSWSGWACNVPLTRTHQSVQLR